VLRGFQYANNADIMDTRQTRFCERPKYSLPMAAVISRTNITYMWRTIEDALKNHRKFAVV
jgi:hypothetical protein